MSMHDIVVCDSRLVESSRFEPVRPVSAEERERSLAQLGLERPSHERGFALEHEPGTGRYPEPWHP